MYNCFGSYDGALCGSVQQDVGGFATLNSLNASGNIEVLKLFWNGTTVHTDLNMDTKNLDLFFSQLWYINLFLYHFGCYFIHNSCQLYRLSEFSHHFTQSYSCSELFFSRCRYMVVCVLVHKCHYSVLFFYLWDIFEQHQHGCWMDLLQMYSFAQMILFSVLE